jgi:hypothetical protein
VHTDDEVVVQDCTSAVTARPAARVEVLLPTG